MADVVDTAEEHATPLLENDIAEVRRKAALMPKGEAGYCDMCGEFSLRLVGKACAPCRDKYKLP